MDEYISGACVSSFCGRKDVHAGAIVYRLVHVRNVCYAYMTWMSDQPPLQSSLHGCPMWPPLNLYTPQITHTPL